MLARIGESRNGAESRKVSEERVLAFRIGSLGDTCVTIPAIRLLRRALPDAEIRLLSNQPKRKGIPAPASVLTGSGLVDGFFEYSGTPNIAIWLELRRWRPAVLAYLMPPRTKVQLVRDWTFFRSVGVRRFLGPLGRGGAAVNRHLPEEPEAARLVRGLESIGKIDLMNAESWSLSLRDEERAAARRLLAWGSAHPYLICSIGCKAQTQDWGIERWTSWSQRVSEPLGGRVGLVMVGGPYDKLPSATVISRWNGPALNLCGLLTPRETAASMEGSILFAGHDSGPMHLAASVGVPIVAVFSARSAPLTWFPAGGARNSIFYNKTPCYGCGLDVCTQYGNRCVKGITVEEVVSETLRITMSKLDAIGAASARL
jgi:ADP-heptose:LPS heptosyltransferase